MKNYEVGQKLGDSDCILIEILEIKSTHKRGKFLCKCGEIFEARMTHVNTNFIKSCGCLNVKLASERLLKHGYSKLRDVKSEYITWYSMVARCTNVKNKDYKNYGGRGIIVCDRWLNSFENFIQDMGDKPTPNHSIDRINVNGNYCPENCKWSTRIEQARNTRSNRMIEYLGQTKCVSEWAEIKGIKASLITGRIESGWTIHEALNGKEKLVM